MSQTTVYQGGVPSHIYDSATQTSSAIPNNASQATQAADAMRGVSQNAIAADKAAGAITTPTQGTKVSSASPDSTTAAVSTAQPSPTTVAVTPASATTSATTPAPAVVSAAQAQQNLLNGGLKGSDLANAQKALSTFQQGHAAATASGIPAPQDAGTGMSDATKTAASTTQAYAPAPEVQDAVSKATQKYTDDYANAMTSQSQTKTLVQQYQDLSNQLGIPALNTQLMNMNNVINGTETDIRNEVTKAGGFATDSQVLAMTNSRNKVMIQNYNNLLQAKSDAMQQLTTLSGLAAQDRQFAADQIDKQLNFDQQQITFATNAQKNAQDSIQKSIDNYGAASVYKQALATGDPTAIARINATMGNGFDLKTAAATPTLAQQVQQANIAQSYASIEASKASAGASRASAAKDYASITRDNAAAAQTTAKAQASQLQGAQAADNVLTAVQTAQKQVGAFSTGLAGTLTGWIGGTPAKNLASTVDTIKSNLAFSELQKMRDNSPTGGALGQVSEGEEKLLSSTVAALDTTQSPAQLKKNLNLVQQHYVSYLQSLGYGYDAATGTVITP